MIYSVWNPARHVYSYFQGPALNYGDVPNPQHLRPQPLGVAADEAAWPLPRGSRPVGEGAEPRGMIATSGSPPMDSTSWLVLLGFLVSGYALRKVLR